MSAHEASADDYVAYAECLLEGGVLTDPWYEGNPRFRAAPVWLSEARWSALARAAEDVAAVYDEVARVCAGDAAIVDRFFELTPAQKIMWQASQPMWHAIARADVFATSDGRIQICEVNSDTPTGEPEAIITGRVARNLHAAEQDVFDPNEGLDDRFARAVEALTAATLGPGIEKTAGLVYPTDITEDLPLVRLYSRALEARGWRVVLGSPFNLSASPDGRPALLGVPCSALVRHYKTDWWGERVPAWRDADPFDDPLPLAGPLSIALGAAARGACAVVNPFGSVLTQNKRAMAFMWEKIDLLSQAARAVVRKYVPYTLRLEAAFPEQLLAEQREWVLKSDYGCEGDEVVVGKLVTKEEWEASLRLAVPGRWIAQRYFECETNAAGESVNHGVYVVAGQAAGIYARVQKGATDVASLSAPVLVRRSAVQEGAAAS
jgi:glutathionylspermidine synthase